jgi:hypothetical protein
MQQCELGGWADNSEPEAAQNIWNDKSNARVSISFLSEPQPEVLSITPRIPSGRLNIVEKFSL